MAVLAVKHIDSHRILSTLNRFAPSCCLSHRRHFACVSRTLNQRTGQAHLRPAQGEGRRQEGGDPRCPSGGGVDSDAFSFAATLPRLAFFSPPVPFVSGFVHGIWAPDWLKCCSPVVGLLA